MTFKKKLKVLITSPSIHDSISIGGISTFVKLLINNNNEIEYLNFFRGNTHRKKRDLTWVLSQFCVVFSFIGKLIKYQKVKIVHINMPFSRFAIYRDSVFILLSKLFCKKVITHLHGGSYMVKDRLSFLRWQIIRLAMVASDRIAVQGKKEKDYINSFYKIPLDRIDAIPNAVSISSFNKTKSISPLVLLYLSRIDKNKGLKEVISALELLNNKIDFKFIIAGDGPDRDYFINSIHKVIPGKYEYLGIVLGDKKAEVFRNADVFLLPSYYEGLPYSLLEAMSFHIIPVVTPVGSIPEIIEHGENGFLVPVKDYKDIVKNIVLLSKDVDLFNEVQKKAYQTIKKNYSIETFLTEMNALYLSLIK